MKILLNGEPREVVSQTLATLLTECAISGRVATAVNEEFVPAGVRGEVILRTGDRIEIITPMQGG